ERDKEKLNFNPTSKRVDETRETTKMANPVIAANSSAAGALTFKQAASKKPSASNPHAQGCLEATVLSVYDLPFADRPLSVTVASAGMEVKSGPPVARHKDRNSYRFAAAGTASGSSPTSASPDVIRLVAPLRELYKSMLKVKVNFSNPNQYLETELPIRQLRIQENKWLILNLTPTPSVGSATTPTNQAMTTASSTTSSLPDEDSMAPPPTIRIKLKLTGPFVDKVEDGTKSSLQKAPKLPSQYNKFLIIPAVPLVAALVVASPVVAGVAMVGLPFFLPVILVIVAVLAGALVSGGVLYSSTRSGRSQVNGIFAPFIEHLVGSRSGQALIYDTGPRPTPVSVMKPILPKGMYQRLLVSLLIDLIGSASYLLPVVGEGLDLAWAPAQTILIMAMYDSTSPNLKYVSFVEEILPFTDVVPSATIGWACEFVPGLLNSHSKNVPPEFKQAVTQLVTNAAAGAGTSTSQS
ncbi:MAG: hypothetical protein SGILL_003743, partial [Bacillariaceae sp.]